MENVNQQADPYIQYTKDIKPRTGFSVLDEAKATGPSLPRIYEQIPDHEERRFNRNPETILCVGAAVGIDEAGEVHHFWADQGLRFLGFLVANSEKELVVKTRGAIILKIEGASEGGRGDKVFCSGPNTFTLRNIGAEIGKVRHFQKNDPGDYRIDRGAVAFRSEGDETPLDLSTDVPTF